MYVSFAHFRTLETLGRWQGGVPRKGERVQLDGGIYQVVEVNWLDGETARVLVASTEVKK